MQGKCCRRASNTLTEHALRGNKHEYCRKKDVTTRGQSGVTSQVQEVPSFGKSSADFKLRIAQTTARNLLKIKV